MTNENKFINRILLPSSYVFGWIILYLLPRRMFNLGGDYSIEPWILFAIIFLGLPQFLRFVLKRNGLKGDKFKAMVYGSILLAIPLVIVIDSEDSEELRIFGKKTSGIIDKAYVSPVRQGSIWNVQAKYVVDGKEYRTSSKKDAGKTLVIGDSVTVIYSSKTPEISEIMELIQRYKPQDASR